MGFYRRAAAYKRNISHVSAKFHLKWCRATPLDSAQREMCYLGLGITLYHVAVQQEGVGAANAWRTIPASMHSANSETWRRWHYSVRVFFMKWTWPSCNTA
jgi:hypothetical protein